MIGKQSIRIGACPTERYVAAAAAVAKPNSIGSHGDGFYKSGIMRASVNKQVDHCRSLDILCVI